MFEYFRTQIKLYFLNNHNNEISTYNNTTKQQAETFKRTNYISSFKHKAAQESSNFSMQANLLTQGISSLKSLNSFNVIVAINVLHTEPRPSLVSVTNVPHHTNSQTRTSHFLHFNWNSKTARKPTFYFSTNVIKETVVASLNVKSGF